MLFLYIQAVFINEALAYPNEVRQSGSSYIWRVNDVDQGSTSSLAAAINNCIGTGNREVHVLVGGTLSEQINLQPGLTLYCHNVTFNKNHTGYGFYRDGTGNIKIYDMILNNNTNMGIRTSRASDLYFQNVRIYGGSIGIRVDSHPSRPYEEGRWVYNLHVQDCRFENGSSHGLETYSVDGFKAYGIIARNMGECGVLLNKTVNGTIGTVDAYRCSYGGGYAGLRFANTCSGVTADRLIARECGRGYFVLSGSNNCHLNNAQITDCTDIGIWLENVANCSVKAGCTNSGVSVSGSGSYANVSSSCSGGSATYYRIQNRGTGLFLDGMGRTVNGDACGQYGNTTHVNAQWEMISTGSYYQFRNRGTGLLLDGMGRTTNGSDLGQYANTTHVNSQWSVQQYSGSYSRIQNRGTGLFIDGMGRTTNGANCGQYANSTSVNAQWQLIAVSGTTSARMETEETEVQTMSEEEVSVDVHPNPTADEVTIILPDSYKDGEKVVNLLDGSGKTTVSEKFNGTRHTLHIRSLPQGMYVLNVLSNKKLIVKKVIKK
jgi:hypothetical protein